MLFSIVAHFYGERLVVQMTHPYQFHAKDEYSMLLFTTYLASDVDPQGVTKFFKRSR